MELNRVELSGVELSWSVSGDAKWDLIASNGQVDRFMNSATVCDYNFLGRLQYQRYQEQA